MRRVVIHVETAQRQWHQLLQLLQRKAHQQPISAKQGHTFTRAARHIGEKKSPQRRALHAPAAVGNQVHLKPARLYILQPVVNASRREEIGANRGAPPYPGGEVCKAAAYEENAATVCSETCSAQPAHPPGHPSSGR